MTLFSELKIGKLYKAFNGRSIVLNSFLMLPGNDDKNIHSSVAKWIPNNSVVMIVNLPNLNDYNVEMLAGSGLFGSSREEIPRPILIVHKNIVGFVIFPNTQFEEI